MKNSRRTTTRQRRSRVTTEEKILLPVHCFKMNTGITFRGQFSLFSQVKYVFACFVNMAESKANDNETFNSAAKSNTYIKRELI